MVKVRDKINDIFQWEEHILPFMIPGWIVRVKDSHNNIDYGWGIVVNFSRKIINLKTQKKIEGFDGSKPQVIIDVLLYLDKKLNNQNQI